MTFKISSRKVGFFYRVIGVFWQCQGPLYLLVAFQPPYLSYENPFHLPSHDFMPFMGWLRKILTNLLCQAKNRLMCFLPISKNPWGTTAPITDYFFVKMINSKYKFMMSHLEQRQKSISAKIPEIKKSLESIELVAKEQARQRHTWMSFSFQ